MVSAETPLNKCVLTSDSTKSIIVQESCYWLNFILLAFNSRWAAAFVKLKPLSKFLDYALVPVPVAEGTILGMMGCKIERTTIQPETTAAALREQQILIVVLVASYLIYMLDFRMCAYTLRMIQLVHNVGRGLSMRIGKKRLIQSLTLSVQLLFIVKQSTDSVYLA